MEHPEDVRGRYRDQIAVAQRLLDSQEKWGGRAEWEVIPTKAGWDVIAWRIEHPDRQGPQRYVPWGYAVIKLDPQLEIVGYQPRG